MSNANVGKVFNMTGGNGGGGSLKLETLTITKQPNKTVYKSGEAFDPTGMIVTAGYGYGLNSDVTGYSVSPQTLTDGVTEVTITYTDGKCAGYCAEGAGIHCRHHQPRQNDLQLSGAVCSGRDGSHRYFLG